MAIQDTINAQIQSLTKKAALGQTVQFSDLLVIMQTLLGVNQSISDDQTLQEVTTAGNTTTLPITAGRLISTSDIASVGSATIGYGILELKSATASTTFNGGTKTIAIQVPADVRF